MNFFIWYAFFFDFMGLSETLSKSYNWLLPKISTRFSTKIALFSNFLSRPRSCHIILYNYTATVCDVSAGVSFFFFLPRFFGDVLSVALLLADFVSIDFVVADFFSDSSDESSFLLSRTLAIVSAEITLALYSKWL